MHGIAEETRAARENPVCENQTSCQRGVRKLKKGDIRVVSE